MWCVYCFIICSQLFGPKHGGEDGDAEKSPSSGSLDWKSKLSKQAAAEEEEEEREAEDAFSFASGGFKPGKGLGGGATKASLFKFGAVTQADLEEEDGGSSSSRSSSGGSTITAIATAKKPAASAVDVDADLLDSRAALQFSPEQQQHSSGKAVLQLAIEGGFAVPSPVNPAAAAVKTAAVASAGGVSKPVSAAATAKPGAKPAMTSAASIARPTAATTTGTGAGPKLTATAQGAQKQPAASVAGAKQPIAAAAKPAGVS